MGEIGNRYRPTTELWSIRGSRLFNVIEARARALYDFLVIKFFTINFAIEEKSLWRARLDRRTLENLSIEGRKITK